MKYMKSTFMGLVLVVLSGQINAADPAREDQIAADAAYAEHLQEQEVRDAIVGDVVHQAADQAINQLVAAHGPELMQNGGILEFHAPGLPPLVIIIQPAGGAVPGGLGADPAQIADAVKAIIPELSGTAEENRAFMDNIKMSCGCDIARAPRPVNQAEIPATCTICENSFAEMGEQSILFYRLLQSNNLQA